MKRTKRTIAIMAFTLVSCSSRIVPASTPTAPAATLRLYATTATAPLVEILSTSYLQTHPNLTFETGSSNYEGVVTRIENAPEDQPIYLLSNHLPADSRLWGAPVGQDGIAIITHPDNPITALSTEALRRIYQGQTTNWRDIGGNEQPIVVISREEGSGTRAEFELRVMGNRRTTPSAQVAPSSTAVIDSVMQQPNSIGYVSMAFLASSVKALAIDGVAPTAESVLDASYPLRMTLFVIGKAEPLAETQPDMRAFIAWMQSSAGQAVIGRRYIPFTP